MGGSGERKSESSPSPFWAIDRLSSITEITHLRLFWTFKTSQYRPHSLHHSLSSDCVALLSMKYVLRILSSRRRVLLKQKYVFLFSDSFDASPRKRRQCQCRKYDQVDPKSASLIDEPWADPARQPRARGTSIQKKILPHSVDICKEYKRIYRNMQNLR